MAIVIVVLLIALLATCWVASKPWRMARVRLISWGAEPYRPNYIRFTPTVGFGLGLRERNNRERRLRWCRTTGLQFMVEARPGFFIVERQGLKKR